MRRAVVFPSLGIGVALMLAAAFAQPVSRVPLPPSICDPLSAFFETESAALSTETLAVVSEAVRAIKMGASQQRQGRIYLTGHAGEREKDRQALSEQRAAAVRAEMVRQGLDGNGIEISGVASSQSFGITFKGDPEALDRRVVIDWQCQGG